jgi:hypothetical protein
VLLMGRSYLLILTAFGEAGTGLLLLFWPSMPIALLLGWNTQASAETFACARVTGAALLAIGVTCWLGRRDPLGPAQLGLIKGVLLYDAVAAGVLSYTGFLGLVGIALWPAVLLHAALAIWCMGCLWGKRGG